MNENVSLAAISVKPGINLEIEYLRAVAVLMVILVHAPVLFPGVDLGQWTGVDLFFCISGYVISRAFEPYFDRYIAEGRWWAAARAFWVRRFFRLAPSAWLWLAVMVGGSWAFNRSGAFGSFADSVKTAGYFLMLSTNLAMPYGLIPTNGFFWSLTLEDQFYFLFPLFLFLVRGHWRWIAFLLLIALQAIPNRSFSSDLPTLLWTTRLDAMMWGILVYKFSSSPLYLGFNPKLLRFRIVAIMVSVALIYLLIKLPTNEFRPYDGSRAESQIALVSAALVFLASFERGYVLPVPRWMRTTLAWIGERSYALYLIHIPVVHVITEVLFRLDNPARGPMVNAILVLAFLIPTAVLADLNFRFIENPARLWGLKFADSILGKRTGTALEMSRPAGARP